MNRLGEPGDLPAIAADDSLVSKAHSEDRHLTSEPFNDLPAYTRLIRCSGTGGKDNPIRFFVLDPADRLIARNCDRMCTRHPDQLEKIVRKTVKTVHNSYIHAASPERERWGTFSEAIARERAVSMAPAFWSVSSYSRSGSESATIPAPV